MMKPFDSKELVARVKAVLRRYQPAKPGGTCRRVKMRQVHGSGGQSLELLRHLHGAGRRYAAKRTGAFIFSCGFAESGFYKRAAIRPHLGL